MFACRLTSSTRYFRPYSQRPLDLSGKQFSSFRVLLRAATKSGRDQGSFVPENITCSFLSTYAGLSWNEKKKMLSNLAGELGTDRETLLEASQNFLKNGTASAESTLRNELVPLYEKAFANVIVQPEGMNHLVNMRADVMRACREDTLDVKLQMLNKNLRRILQEWFMVGFLNLQRITWDKPASMLEKIKNYSEEIHPMRSWEDLKFRIGHGRRCFGYFHPSLPNEPVVFIEVALTHEITSKIQILTHHPSDHIDEKKADTAIFYAIITPKEGLGGIDLGHLIIENVVNELKLEFPNLVHFSTLSPIPGFRNWLETVLNQYLKDVPKFKGQPLLIQEECKAFTNVEEGEPHFIFQKILNQEKWLGDPFLNNIVAGPLLRLAARYLIKVKKQGFAFDPVANFHFRNGARLEAINWMGDPSPKRVRQSYGIMVNYLYPLDQLHINNEAYLVQHVVARSQRVGALLENDVHEHGIIWKK